MKSIKLLLFAFSLILPLSAHALDGFRFSLVNESTGEATSLVTGAVIPPSDDKYNVTITSAGTVPSRVRITIKQTRPGQGAQTKTRTEVGTFSVFGTNEGVILDGRYEVTVWGYSGSTVVAKDSIVFSGSPLNRPSLELVVTSPLNATGTPVTNGATIERSAGVNFRVNPKNMLGAVSSVRIVASCQFAPGQNPRPRCIRSKSDTLAPYIVLAPNEDLFPGSYRVTATARVRANGRTSLLKSAFAFTVSETVDQPPVTVPNNPDPIDPPSVGSDPEWVVNGRWRGSFEKGFPERDWNAYDNGTYRSSGTSPMGSTWTTISGASATTVVGGKRIVLGSSHGQKIYKGSIQGVTKAKDGKHRPYPVVHFDNNEFPSIIANQWRVFVPRSSYPPLKSTDWIHLATWGGNTAWEVVTLGFMNNRMNFTHVDNTRNKFFDASGNPIIKNGKPDPYANPAAIWDRWFTVTVVIDFRGEGRMAAYFDGVKRMEASGGKLKIGSTKALMRAHWGLYSMGHLTSGEQYNDDIQLWKLDSFDWGTRAPKSPFN